MIDWGKYEIDISKVRGGKTTCPKCSHNRKDKNDKCLSVDTETGLFNCHHCGFKGNATVFEKAEKDFTTPLPRLEKVSEKMIEWFKGRGISNNTILRFGISESKEFMPLKKEDREGEAKGEMRNCICFNFYRGEKLVNIKFRDALKNFKLFGGAELIFYNLSALEGQKSCVIVEGEMDCLSMHESGIYNALSVPNGASKGSQKLKYLDNCWKDFEGIEKIILCVDNDEAGQSLREELARRLGKERCWFVSYPDGCKDANEVLLKYGKDDVLAMVNSATIYPLDAVLTVDDMAENVETMFAGGYPKGYAAGISGFDEHLSFVSGQLTMVTGIPGSGKDEFVNNITVGLAKAHDWRFGICGFEEPPQITVTKILEKYTGLSFDFRRDHNHRMTQESFWKGMIWTDEHYRFINTDEVDATVEGVIKKLEQLVKRYGINGAVISPWNCFEHAIPFGMSETLYVSQALGKILSFCKKNDVHVFLIAHPTKVQKDKTTKRYEVPTLYSISGSANFFNKTHNGISIDRDFQTGVVDVYVQKVKWSWLGKIGFCSFQYDTMTRQYIPIA